MNKGMPLRNGNYIATRISASYHGVNVSSALAMFDELVVLVGEDGLVMHCRTRAGAFRTGLRFAISSNRYK